MTDYASGYGQARADLLKMLTDGLQIVNGTIMHQRFQLTKEQLDQMIARKEALLWVRAMAKSIKPNR